MGANEAAVADISADVNVAADAWDREAVTAAFVDRIAKAAWSNLPSEPGNTAEAPVSFGLLLADDAAVRELNASFRGQDKPTNVLSFPAGDDGLVHEPGAARHLGDIALGFETVAREASETGRSMADHTAHLIVHGLLHVLGYDHQTDDEAEAMEGLETQILAELGIDDPYQGTEPVRPE